MEGWNRGDAHGRAGITWTGLQKAVANPDIRNIIFDLTANAGGSQDLMSSIIGLFTGDVAIHGYNHLTKQHMQAVFTTDRNMDGVIDEKDKDVVYDYHLGVLTSRLAFSCGNLFPVIMQEKGAAVIGENTGGGSCVVQMVSLSDGQVFMMSICGTPRARKWRMVQIPIRPLSGSKT